MIISPSGYVHLRVRERRFVGSWSAFINIILPVWQLRKDTKKFSIPVNHLVRNGVPNKFPAVVFKRSLVLQIIDNRAAVPRKPIQLYTAETAELSDTHIDLLTEAIMHNGCCLECPEYAYEQNMYRL